MKQYEKYKDSGIAWLGIVPEHWCVNKLSRAFDLIGSGTTPTAGKSEYYDNADVNWLLTGDLNDSDIVSTSKKITSKAFEEHSALKLYPKDSVVIAMYGATIGKLGYLQIETSVNQACCVINNSKKVIQKYLFYFLLANKNNIISLSYGGGQPNISQEVIKRLAICEPSKDEQRKIAEYLDYTVGRVDEIMIGKQAQIDRLMGYRKSMINEVVTKGLNPDAPMRDSGIEWLGEIPVHWGVFALKYCVNINNGSDYKHVVANNGYPVFGSGGQFAYASEYMYDGEVIFFGRKGTINKPIHYIGKFWAVDTMFYAIPRDNINGKYIYFQAINLPFDLYSTSTALPSMTQTDLNNHIVCVPPTINEQTQIVSYVEEQTTKIDKIVKELTSQIEKLKEYKTSIISEAVTGKIDLREWKQPLK